MIEITYYYNYSEGNWRQVTQKFHDWHKAFRFMFVLKKSPKMVFLSITGDDKYEVDLIRRKTGVDKWER